MLTAIEITAHVPSTLAVNFFDAVHLPRRHRPSPAVFHAEVVRALTGVYPAAEVRVVLERREKILIAARFDGESPDPQGEGEAWLRQMHRVVKWAILLTGSQWVHRYARRSPEAAATIRRHMDQVLASADPTELDLYTGRGLPSWVRIQAA